jgi:dCMP deaminase
MAMGYHGTPKISQTISMSNHKWDQRYLKMAREVAGWSQDPSTGCGAVIVRPDKTIASVGFNGFPQGLSDAAELYLDRQTKLSRMVHSEVNALSFTRDQTLTGYTVYAWPMPPCDRCTAQLVQKKIGRVVCPRAPADKAERWHREFAEAEKMWLESGAQVDYMEIEAE